MVTKAEREKENEHFEERIAELEKSKRKDRVTKIILIIIIIILLLMFCLLGWRMGKIGYGGKEIATNAGNNDNKTSMIIVTQGDIELTKNTKLNIFNNAEYGGEKIIAPKSKRNISFLHQK